MRRCLEEERKTEQPFSPASSSPSSSSRHSSQHEIIAILQRPQFEVVSGSSTSGDDVIIEQPRQVTSHSATSGPPALVRRSPAPLCSTTSSVTSSGRERAPLVIIPKSRSAVGRGRGFMQLGKIPPVHKPVAQRPVPQHSSRQAPPPQLSAHYRPLDPSPNRQPFVNPASAISPSRGRGRAAAIAGRTISRDFLTPEQRSSRTNSISGSVTRSEAACLGAPTSRAPRSDGSNSDGGFDQDFYDFPVKLAPGCADPEPRPMSSNDREREMFLRTHSSSPMKTPVSLCFASDSDDPDNW